MMKRKNVPKAVSDYMAKIGAKGGTKGKGTEERKSRAKKAAEARWNKAREDKPGE